MGTADAEMYTPSAMTSALSNVLSFKRPCTVGWFYEPYLYLLARQATFIVGDSGLLLCLSLCLMFYSLAFLACCFELYRPNYYLQSSFNFIFLTISPLSLQWGKKQVPSAEKPALTTVLSLFRDDVPSVDSICFILCACQVGVSLPGSCLRYCIRCYACDVCRTRWNWHTGKVNGKTDTMAK